MILLRLFLPLLFFTTAHATDFVVTTADDEPDNGGGLTYEQADGNGLSLREAIGLANRNGENFLILEDDSADFGTGGGEEDGDTITFATDLATRLLIDSTFTITDDLSIDGNLTIDAQDADRIFTIITYDAPGSGSVTLKGLRLENGNAPDGGAIYYDGSDPVDLDTIIIINSTAGIGGAIVSYGSELLIRSCIIAGNSASTFNDSLGGAVYVGGISTVSVIDSTISVNTAKTSGGGIAIDFDGVLKLIGTSEITRNIAEGTEYDEGGGGIYNSGGIIDFTEFGIGTISSNTTSGSGGGILVDNEGTLNNIDTTDPRGFRYVPFGANSAAIDGGGIAFINNTGPGTTFIGAGFATNSAGRDGGGISMPDTFGHTIDRFLFFGNTAAERGGGASLFFTNLSGCAFLNNTASQGGGLYSSGDLEASVGSIFYQNEATGENGRGGGLYFTGGIAKFTHSDFQENLSSSDGAGIYLDNGDLTLEESVVQKNVAGGAFQETFGSGGGLATRGLCNVTFDRSSIDSNTASFFGGGCSFDSETTFLARRSSITNNESYFHGGGISAEYGSESFTLEDSTIAKNRAFEDGGGISIRGGGFLTLTNVTITENTASGDTGGLSSDSSFTEISNSVISGNSAPDSTVEYFITPPNTSFIGGDPLLFPIATPTIINFPSGSTLDIPTLTYQPHPHSPLIDAGTARESGLFDQRGNPRTIGASTDIGATEHQNNPPILRRMARNRYSGTRRHARRTPMALRVSANSHW